MQEESQNQENISDEMQEEQQSEKKGCGCSQIKLEREEYKQNWQRALADYQNLQKEVASRRAELVSMSEQQILEEFIPVYDNFKKAFASWDNTNGSGPTNDTNKKLMNWKQGIEYIMKQFADILKAHNVVEIKTVGEKFDTKFHEAVGEEESEFETGTIIREVEGGYLMGGRVLKVARVVIAK
jgi:molecular chaperone GrpE